MGEIEKEEQTRNPDVVGVFRVSGQLVSNKVCTKKKRRKGAKKVWVILLSFCYAFRPRQGGNLSPNQGKHINNQTKMP